MARNRSRPITFALRDPRELMSDHDRGLGVRLLLAYGALASVGAGMSIAFVPGTALGHPEPWLRLPPLAAAGLSVSLGVAIAFGVVLATRYTVARFSWARQLHSELQPLACRLGEKQIVPIAIFSGLGEELFFRAFLTPTIGVLASCALFGVLHQIRGPSRWVWVGWATLVGASFAIVFAATGSILGPVLAHALINAINLTFLRTHVVTAAAPASAHDRAVPTSPQ
jgi:hypothetical protein